MPFLALAVTDIERIAVVGKSQRRGIPASRNESANRAVLTVGNAYDGDRIIVSVGDIEKLALVVDQEGVRRRSFRSEWGQRGRQTLENLQASGVDHMDGIVVRTRYKETAIGRDLHIVRIHTDVERPDDLVGRSINNAHRFTGPVGDEQTLAIRG